jgi:hypothetical protein
MKQLMKAVVFKEQRPHGKKWDEPMEEEGERDPFVAAIINDAWAQEAEEWPSFADLSPRFDEAAVLAQFLQGGAAVDLPGSPARYGPTSPRYGSTSPTYGSTDSPAVQSVQEQARREAEERTKRAEQELAVTQQQLEQMKEEQHSSNRRKRRSRQGRMQWSEAEERRRWSEGGESRSKR